MSEGRDALEAWLAAQRAREDPYYEALHHADDFPANWNFGVPLLASAGARTNPVHESLGPTRTGGGLAGDASLVCDTTRCTDVESGLFVPLLTIRSSFEPTRSMSDRH